MKRRDQVSPASPLRQSPPSVVQAQITFGSRGIDRERAAWALEPSLQIAPGRARVFAPPQVGLLLVMDDAGVEKLGPVWIEVKDDQRIDPDLPRATSRRKRARRPR